MVNPLKRIFRTRSQELESSHPLSKNRLYGKFTQALSPLPRSYISPFSLLWTGLKGIFNKSAGVEYWAGRRANGEHRAICADLKRVLEDPHIPVENKEELIKFVHQYLHNYEVIKKSHASYTQIDHLLNDVHRMLRTKINEAED